MTDETTPALSFGDVRFDSERDVFRWKSGQRLDLRPQSHLVLKALAATPGEVVQKHALFETVWPGLSVGDDSLVQCIGEIRQSLADKDRKIVRTVPGQGYKLMPAEAREPMPEGAATKGVPRIESSPIRYVRASGGINIAWSSIGAGVPVLFAPDFSMRQLDKDLTSRIYAPFLDRVAQIARVVRFDRRGNGLSDWQTDEFSTKADVADMEAVAKAAGLRRFFIMAKNFGTAPAIAYAARHPDQVLGIITTTAFVTGHVASNDVERKRIYDVGRTVAGIGADSPDPTFLRYVATRIFPDGPAEIWSEVEEYYRTTTNAGNFVRQYELQHRVDMREIAATLRLPLLILHARGCRLTPFSEATTLASLVAGARLISLDGENAWPLHGTAEFETCLQEITGFLSAPSGEPL